MNRSDRPVLVVVLLAMVSLIAGAAMVPDARVLPPSEASPASGEALDLSAADSATAHAGPSPAAPTSTPTPSPGAETTAPGRERRPKMLPGGRKRIFGGNRFLVAYYGTANTGALGVLGETPPDVMHRRLRRAAAPFARRRQPVQLVYELIVSIADGYAGKGGDFSHDIARSDVQRYIDAAHRNGALLLLDLQPGRSDFLSTAKRWAWALKDPYVGLALDPEWRMGPRGVPATRIGSVRAGEVNRVSAWLGRLVRAYSLPQKLFVLHQFRTDMIGDIGAVRPRRGLVMVQQVDGFGTPGQKLDTFHTVARPRQFFMGFKLFYDEDVRRMSAAEVRRVRPAVRFVSFQ